MSVYTVHEPPLRAAATSPDPERFVFVRDGFYVWAFLLTPLWMLWHRQWLVLLIYVVVTLGIANAMDYAGIGASAGYVVAILISLMVGMEAGTLRRWTLALRGYRHVGVAAGSNAEVAERRFFKAWADAASAKPVGPTAPPAVPPPLPRMPQAPDIVGLFPEPGASR